MLVLVVGLAGWGAALLALGWVGERRLRDLLPPPDPSLHGLAQRTARDHLLFVVAAFAVAGLGLMAVVLSRGRPGLVRLGAILLVGGVFLQSGFMLRRFNPTVDETYFYPRTEALDRVSAITGTNQTLRLDETGLMPDVNLWYRLPTPGTYDALGVDRYDALYRRLLRTPLLKVAGAILGLLDRPVHPHGLGNLRVLGIQYVTTAQPYPFGDLASPPEVPGTVVDGEVRFDFVPTEPRLDVVAIDLPGTAAGTADDRTCALSVRDGQSRPLATTSASCGLDGAVFSLPELRVDTGEQLQVRVSPDPGPPLEGGPTTLTAYSTPVAGLELVDEVQGFRVFRVPESPDRYFSPAATVVTTSTRIIDDPDARPWDLSVVDRGAEAPPGEVGEVDVIEESATSIRLQVRRTDPGWLVALQASFPGWQATVDGRAVDISTANGAFLGVPVPEGTSDVVLRFRPRSVQIGGLVSALSLVTVAVAGAIGAGGTANFGPLLRRRPR